MIIYLFMYNCAETEKILWEWQCFLESHPIHVWEYSTAYYNNDRENGKRKCIVALVSKFLKQKFVCFRNQFPWLEQCSNLRDKFLKLFMLTIKLNQSGNVRLEILRIFPTKYTICFRNACFRDFSIVSRS